MERMVLASAQKLSMWLHIKSRRLLHHGMWKDCRAQGAGTGTIVYIVCAAEASTLCRRSWQSHLASLHIGRFQGGEGYGRRLKHDFFLAMGEPEQSCSWSSHVSFTSQRRANQLRSKAVDPGRTRQGRAKSASSSLLVSRMTPL